MSNPIEGKRILLGVTGSIACYKAADLASKLTQAGALVDVVLTQAAMQFITPLTFESVTGRQAYSEKDLWGGQGHVLHIGLGHAADLLLIAPASANTLAKLAHGLADNLLTVTALASALPATDRPGDGWRHVRPPRHASQPGAAQAARRPDPGSGGGAPGLGLAGGGAHDGARRSAGAGALVFGAGGALRGRKVVVTAGGTQEAIDPVRAITNRSSGKQGFALAQAALDLGAEVTLIAGNTALSAPAGARRVDVVSAEEMRAAVLAALPGADALLMAAAVADFKPAQAAAQKIKKQAGAPTIQLALAADILAAVADDKAQHGFPRITVGFAAESQALLENAQAKLVKKKLDLIVANDISARDAGFAVDENRVTLLDAAGGVEPLPLMSKAKVAEAVLERLVALLTASDQPL